MQSFRTELENPVVEKDILELEKKIALFKEGKIDEEKFRSLRLARGVYGQRQEGVQMIRIKIPYGKLTSKQFLRICEVSDEYSVGMLHATTRQDIQIHYVSLDRTPQLWADLEKDKVTLREACGNTVRNITASPTAGIDPNEPFDVTPYAHEMFEYFLRNPICQEMGRKFKIAISSSEQDTAFAYIHDVGLVPRIKDGKKGFRVLVGGGLGAQPALAEEMYDFLEADQIVPLTESMLRVFDRYGERNRRHKARFKFLLKDIGLDGLRALLDAEQKAIANKTYAIDDTVEAPVLPAANITYEAVEIKDEEKYKKWLDTNVFEQKQKGYYGVWLRVLLGNITTDIARKLVAIVGQHAADDIRVTVNQGYLLRYVKPEALKSLYVALDELNLAAPGFDSTADITACPGTDTCNLGISSSTGAAKAFEDVITNEFPDLIYNSDIKIKISGCPNSCGQHGLAAIGFHGSSIKAAGKIMPALQVMLGGGFDGVNNGQIGEKVIKLPSRRAEEALRWLLRDYEDNAHDGELYYDYFRRQGKIYFYDLLKPLGNVKEEVKPEEFIDFGRDEQFEVIKAVGECAGVVIDLVTTLLYETEEKHGFAVEALAENRYADAIYHSYNVMINGAKALLLTAKAPVNTQASIIASFDENLIGEGKFELPTSFNDYVLQLNQNEPSEAFAKKYFADAEAFLAKVKVSAEKSEADNVELPK